MNNYHLNSNKLTHSQEREINDIICGKAVDTFIISLIICFISIFAGFVLAVFVVRMLVERNII